MYQNMTQTPMNDIYSVYDNDTHEDVLFAEETITGLAARVLLYNDEEHSMDEVTYQIIKAIGCSYAEAEDLTWEVHTRGKAVVYSGDMPDCLRVSSILEEIALHTEVEL